MPGLFRCLILLLLLGPVTSAEAEDDPVPPGHREAMAACNIQNKELCGWWESSGGYDPLLVFGTRWEEGAAKYDCKVVTEERNEERIFSAFICHYELHDKTYAYLLSVSRDRMLMYDSLVFVYSASSECDPGKAMELILVDPDPAHVRDGQSWEKCQIGYSRYARPASLRVIQ